VDTLHIPLFHGGGSPEYFPEKDQFIKLRELTLEAKPIPNGNRNQEETQEPALDWQI
jgi:hypothetical protein